MVDIDAEAAYIKITLAADALLQVQKLSSQLGMQLQDFGFLSAIFHHAVLSLC